MISFLFMLSLLGFALFLIEAKIDPLKQGLIICSFIIFCLYWFAIFDQLLFGIYLLDLLGMLFLVRACTRIHKIFSCIQHTAYIAPYFCLILGLLYFVPSDYQFSEWDEFADWGLAAKYLFSENRLYSYSTLDYFNYRHYPPAQQLFQYWVAIHFGWSEAIIMRAQLALILLIQLSMFAGLKRFKLIVFIGYLTSLTLAWQFDYFYNTIYADTFLAVYFSATLFWVFCDDKKPVEWAICCLLIFNLVLIKQIGLVLAVIVIIVYGARIILSQFKFSGKLLIFTPSFQISSLRRKSYNAVGPTLPTLYFLGPIISIILAYQSWAVFKNYNGVPSNKSEHIPSVIHFFEDPLFSRASDTIHKFFLLIQDFLYPLHLPFYQIVIFLFGISIFISLIWNQKKRLEPCIMLLIVGAGAIAYIGFMVFSFILFFSEWEGTRLFGFSRYIGIYLVAWTLLIFALFIRYSEDALNRQWITASICGLLIYIAHPWQYYPNLLRLPAWETVSSDRNRMNALIKNLNGIPVEAKIYFLSQGDNGFLTRIFHYSIAPRLASTSCRSFPRKGVEDPESCKISFNKAIEGYDYLLLFNADHEFWITYGKYFSREEANQIYQIQWRNSEPFLVTF